MTGNSDSDKRSRVFLFRAGDMIAYRPNLFYSYCLKRNFLSQGFLQVVFLFLVEP